MFINNLTDMAQNLMAKVQVNQEYCNDTCMLPNVILIFLIDRKSGLRFQLEF